MNCDHKFRLKLAIIKSIPDTYIPECDEHETWKWLAHPINIAWLKISLCIFVRILQSYVTIWRLFVIVINSICIEPARSLNTGS
jgi:hypothetical protein